MEDKWLSFLLILPALGAVLCAVLPRARTARVLALAVSLLEAAVFIPVLFGFNFASPGVQFETWMGEVESMGFGLHLGIDSISVWLAALTIFLQPLAIAASFASIREREKEYYGWMLALLSAMLGVFFARDALLFYIFFELTLVPMFFIIGVWGGPERRYAAAKFFLFTFAGSVFTLAAIIYLGVRARTFDLGTVIIAAQSLPPAAKFWITLGFLAGFAVKVPLFPVHTWLPLAHTEAPTAGSVILAGVLLKLGTYGILRLALPIGMVVRDYHAPIYSFNLIYGVEGTRITITFLGLIQSIGVIGVIGVIYGALVAWVQQDIKKLVAYSSVSHLGFCVLGLAALNHEGVQGSVLYMVNHGLSTGAMFLVIGMIYDRFHTRDIKQLSGLARRMPVMSFFFILFTFSSIGLPGLNGFPSEFLTILGAFRSEYLGIGFGSFAALGVILGALYMLHMAARVIWGPLKYPHADEHHGQQAHGDAAAGPQADSGQGGSGGHADHGPALPVDLSGREIGILIPLALAVVIIGVIPARLLKTFEPAVTELIGEVKPPVQQPALAEAAGPAEVSRR